MCRANSSTWLWVSVRQAHLWSVCVLLALLLQLSGCGFQLRSWEMGSAYNSVGLDSAARFAIEPSLRRALSQTGVPLVANNAELVLELLDSDEELRTASVSGAARTAEFELILRVRYAIRDANGTYLAEPTVLTQSRRYFLNRDNLVGSNEEQALLRRELRGELVQQIMRVLNTVSRTGPATVIAPAAALDREVGLENG